MDLAGGALLDIGVYALSIARSFMESKPDQVLSQVKFAPTGADEQAGILLMNKEAQMATLALSLHSNQPKRAVISSENGYIEIMDYQRADQAVIVEAESGVRHTVNAGETKKALQYEMEDMEQAIKTGNVHKLKISDTKDVMDIMTDLRKKWNKKYPPQVVKVQRKNLSANTTKKDGGRVIRLDEEHKCPFLSENRLCRLVSAYGDSILSETCTVFPREVHRFETHEEEVLMPCCPAVIDLWAEEENVVFPEVPENG